MRTSWRLIIALLTSEYHGKTPFVCSFLFFILVVDFISLIGFFLLSYLFKLQRNVNNSAPKPHKMALCQVLSYPSVTLTVALARNSAGLLSGSVGAWINSERKYLELKSEGKQTAPTKVMSCNFQQDMNRDDISLDYSALTAQLSRRTFLQKIWLTSLALQLSREVG